MKPISESRPSPRRIMITTVVLVALIAGGTIALLSGYRIEREDKETAQAKTAAAETDKQAVVDVAAPVLSQLREQCDTDAGRKAVRELGLSCTAVTSGAVTVEKAANPAATTPRTVLIQGPAGPPPSTTAIARVVRSQLGGVVRSICGGTCAGEDGTSGTNGPTLDEVLAGAAPSITLQLTNQVEACIASGRCVGPRGESVKGEKGDSIKGDDGQDAYPFTFRFTQLGVTYDCTVTDPAVTAECSSTAPPVDPEPTPTPGPTDPVPTLLP